MPLPFFLNASLAWFKEPAARDELRQPLEQPPAWWLPGLLKTAAAHAGSGASMYEPIISSYPEPPNPQFYVGGPGSGAPPHYHEDAVNVLMHGRKRWWLQPPRWAEYSTVPAVSYVTHVLGSPAEAQPASARDAPAVPPPLQCVQEAGDVLYVPRGWGHAVLNLRTSVGYAVEFATPLQRY